ncbi:sulfhydryl oxidase 2-like [Rutidosis leptorrhynchoides]|uniref:sulfhydryl oxidase 2-like n=1 Tax=Rutidosis leptorrhynchoides TaxID=125765 RepID=UPI003A9957B4
MFKLFTTLLILSTFISSSSSSSTFPNFSTIGSRSILRAIKRDIHQSNFVVDLNATNFDLVLKETPASFVIVEFYAHWCPACRNYKPQYEKVARLFNGAKCHTPIMEPGAVHPGILLMTRVDCASKINTKLCDKFSIPYYPLLLWGPPYKFVGGHWNGKKEQNGIYPIEDGKTADLLLTWINTHLGSSYCLEDEKFENDNLLLSNISDAGKIASGIYDVEEATSVAFDIIMEHKMISPDTRAAFIKFLKVLTVAHNPSRRCRKGSAEILVNFDDLYSSRMVSMNKDEPTNSTIFSAMHTFQICGKDIPCGYWMFCRGSKNDTRGFSCGLWVLLHSLSVRVDDGEIQLAFIATCDFIHKFFICEECRQHFYDMCSSVTTPLNTTRAFVLWLWTTHNKVNERLMKNEASLGTGDPKFPKIIWPPKPLCPSCYTTKNQTENSTIDWDWDYDEVFKFLIGYYGNMLISRYKDKDTETMSLYDSKTSTSSEDLVASRNALAVPVGAAMAIAVASCLFGAVAYVWRSQQKNRKQRRI